MDVPKAGSGLTHSRSTSVGPGIPRNRGRANTSTLKYQKPRNSTRPSSPSGSAGDSLRRRLGFGLIPARLGAVRGIVWDERALTKLPGTGWKWRSPVAEVRSGRSIAGLSGETQ